MSDVWKALLSEDKTSAHMFEDVRVHPETGAACGLCAVWQAVSATEDALLLARMFRIGAPSFGAADVWDVRRAADERTAEVLFAVVRCEGPRQEGHQSGAVTQSHWLSIC